MVIACGHNVPRYEGTFVHVVQHDGGKDKIGNAAQSQRYAYLPAPPSTQDRLIYLGKHNTELIP